jgi:hypothetical protein
MMELRGVKQLDEHVEFLFATFDATVSIIVPKSSVELELITPRMSRGNKLIVVLRGREFSFSDHLGMTQHDFDRQRFRSVVDVYKCISYCLKSGKHGRSRAQEMGETSGGQSGQHEHRDILGLDL